jgi:hypothetical protein
VEEELTRIPRTRANLPQVLNLREVYSVPVRFIRPYAPFALTPSTPKSCHCNGCALREVVVSEQANSLFDIRHPREVYSVPVRFIRP